jgi:hypothetical protein
MIESFHIEHDIVLYTLKASSFPDGVLAAHQQLHKLIPMSEGIEYFGISRPDESGKIGYRAAVACASLDPQIASQLDVIVLPKGHYVGLYISNFMENVQQVAHAFRRILTYPRIDPNGWCVERYEGMNDVRCMVRLED